MRINQILVFFLFVFSISHAHSHAQEMVRGRPSVIWKEAESSVDHNFSPGVLVDVKNTETVSGQEYLQLTDDGDNNTGELPHYYASYHINSAAPENYVLWVAASPQNDTTCNPITVVLNGSIRFGLKDAPYASGSYGNNPGKKFGWIRVGTVKLHKGNNTIKVQIDPRNGRQFTAWLDAFFLTTDPAYTPQGPLPTISPQPNISRVLQTKSLQAVSDSLEYQLYQRRIRSTREDIGIITAKDVIARLKKRRLPGPVFTDPGTHEFGVHGMEAPFVRKGKDSVKIALAYELLARTGVQSFRTAESCWHRLGDDYSDYRELDYQVKNAGQYGMTQLFTVGYPPPKFSQSGMNLAAVNPAYEADYRKYLHNLISRYKDKGLQYVELGNEVDAPDVWWHNSSPAQYVWEMKMLKQETGKLSNTIKTVGFASTYSRDNILGGISGGRRFVDSCFALGINKYADAYSLHYTWPLSEKGFVGYFKSKLADSSDSAKQLLNSEESAYGKPSDIIKLFARDFFLYNFKRVDYYLARDWFEAGNMLYCGLFDINWNPKRRLLAYAASVDAIRNRELLGMARPATNIEAYVLQRSGGPAGSKYAVIIWQNVKTIKESLEPQAFDNNTIPAVSVTGLKGKLQVEKWNLDMVTYPRAPLSIKVTDEPLIVYTNVLPNWKLISPEQFLDNHDASIDPQKGLVPGQ